MSNDNNRAKTYLCVYQMLAITAGDVSWLALVIALSVGVTFAILYLLRSWLGR
ncbi:MAG: hypothetical protein QXX64_04170 [Nitrososphaera sp.]|uniref:Uncharacterized protein n=1 Tax=Nitrososphaera gargensis (strain Ga9.2) TaxID=1237085 RepID=K0IKJ7_NITGG|nr:hypothetical protein [Candidatus Nitrososphaera gargensis]AFU59803.1 hypothetical protein Ngar_c28840 [Candidatus Nitrososphaera gargensis Ga9.2]